MTFYEKIQSKGHRHSKMKSMICPSCFREYTLGKDGTVNGCDTCEGITRNADGMIIPNPSQEVFIHEVSHASQ